VTGRPRFKQALSLEQRLGDQANRWRKQADSLPHGALRQIFLRKAEQAETAVRIRERLRSPPLQPSK
jgi:hypothetical protein